MSAEEWRDVVGAEGRYQVSSLGRVLSTCRRKPRVLKLAALASGYLMVSIGQHERRLVHALVAEAFIGPRPDGTQVAHLDGVRSHNATTNLRYATPAENAQDREMHGRTVRGEQHPLAKLTPDQVLEIRVSTMPQRRLAKLYGISQGHVSQVRLRKVWTTI